jgi:hypothetical protein
MVFVWRTPPPPFWHLREVDGVAYCTSVVATRSFGPKPDGLTLAHGTRSRGSRENCQERKNRPRLRGGVFSMFWRR